MSEPTTAEGLLTDNFGLPTTREGQLEHSRQHREEGSEHVLVGYCPVAQRVKRIEAAAAESRRPSEDGEAERARTEPLREAARAYAEAHARLAETHRSHERTVVVERLNDLAKAALATPDRADLRVHIDSGDIDVRRLAEAMRPLFDGPESVQLERLGWWEDDLFALTRKDIAIRVAREYARLSTPRTETSEPAATPDRADLCRNPDCGVHDHGDPLWSTPDRADPDGEKG